MSKLLSVILFWTILLGGYSCYAQLYVSTSGNDSNAGNSIASPFKTIQRAAVVATPGTTVYILAGTYNERITPLITGLPGQITTFKNYQQDLVIIDPSGTTGWGIWNFYGSAYLSLEGLNFSFVDSTAAAYQTGLLIGSTSHHLTIKNCHFTGMRNLQSTGILLYGNDTTAAGVHDIFIDGCEIADTTWHMSQGILGTGNVKDIVISNNLIHHCQGVGIALSGGDSICTKAAYDYVRNATVTQNRIHHIYNKQPGTYQNGLLIGGCRNSVFNRNSISACDFGITIFANSKHGIANFNTISNNQVYRNYQNGLQMGTYDYPNNGRVYNCIVANNTFFYNNELKNGMETVYFPFDSCTIKNNIFYCNSSNNMLYAYFYDSVFTKNVIDLNLFASPINNPGSVNINWLNNACTTFGYYKMIANCDMNSLYGDPNFVDPYTAIPDFRIYNGSSAIDAGFPGWNLSGTLDFEGQTRNFGSAIDIGCDENHGDQPIPVFNEINTIASTALAFYPNPAINQITCTAQLEHLEVKNCLGQVMSFSSSYNANGQMQLNVEHLPSGIYILSYRNQQKVGWYRFVKN
jgi:hypothetical protein